ncbi:Hypothetical predicted protein [Octopus vulgaris]|uniref:Uncharacterized protein n=1 Tax=Octopus vulgaris TaxID=6645 RepID=A0AA36BRV0_OCTVU|nr:Hypothetical predicted protein [Octopus vulgaris]
MVMRSYRSEGGGDDDSSGGGGGGVDGGSGSDDNGGGGGGANNNHTTISYTESMAPLFVQRLHKARMYSLHSSLICSFLDIFLKAPGFSQFDLMISHPYLMLLRCLETVQVKPKC